VKEKAGPVRHPNRERGEKARGLSAVLGRLLWSRPRREEGKGRGRARLGPRPREKEWGGRIGPSGQK